MSSHWSQMDREVDLRTGRLSPDEYMCLEGVIVSHLMCVIEQPSKTLDDESAPPRP